MAKRNRKYFLSFIFEPRYPKVDIVFVYREKENEKKSYFMFIAS